MRAGLPPRQSKQRAVAPMEQSLPSHPVSNSAPRRFSSAGYSSYRAGRAVMQVQESLSTHTASFWHVTTSSNAFRCRHRAVGRPATGECVCACVCGVIKGGSGAQGLARRRLRVRWLQSWPAHPSGQVQLSGRMQLPRL